MDLCRVAAHRRSYRVFQSKEQSIIDYVGGIRRDFDFDGGAGNFGPLVRAQSGKCPHGVAFGRVCDPACENKEIYSVGFDAFIDNFGAGAAEHPFLTREKNCAKRI